MEEIAIIHDKSELEGTCYIEIAPGKYQMKHWQEGSLFFDEEAFGFIEPIFERCIDGYDHYGMNDASKSEWIKIINELEDLNSTLSKSETIEEILGKVGFVFGGTRDRFQNNFEESKHKLIEMNKELISWSSEALNRHEYIAVLGI